MEDPFAEVRTTTVGVLAGRGPFADQPGAPPPRLVGRRPQLAALLELIGRVDDGVPGGGLFLPGPRGLGKTSLLVAAADEASRRGVCTVRVELTPSAKESTSLLVQSLSRAFDRSRLTDLASRVTGVTLGGVGLELADRAEPSTSITQLLLEAAAGEGLLVLVDEAQEHPASAAAIVRAVHRAQQDGVAAGAVLAGLPRVVDDVIRVVSYAERWPSTPLGSLSDDDAFEAIAQPLDEEGVELPQAHLGKVATLTGGYPFFVQVLGTQLWAAADDPSRITDAAFATAARGTADRTSRWMSQPLDRLPDRQLTYLLAANDVGWPARTGAINERMGGDHSSLAPLRAALLDDGLLWSPRRGEVDLVVPPLRVELARRGTS